jgi:hypothetical protein
MVDAAAREDSWALDAASGRPGLVAVILAPASHGAHPAPLVKRNGRTARR